MNENRVLVFDNTVLQRHRYMRADQESSFDVVAAAMYHDELFAATTSRNKDLRAYELTLWRPDQMFMWNKQPERQVLRNLEDRIMDDVLAFGTVHDQLVLAVGQRKSVLILPITEGALGQAILISEEATALAFAPDDILLIGKRDGVIAVKLCPGI